MTSNPEIAFHSGAPLTITVRSLRAQNDGAEVSVGILMECGEHREQKNLLLTMEQYCELKPCKGRITEDCYEQLEAASRLCAAMRCGENLLSYGANSVQMLIRKIMQRGFSKENATRAAEKLQEMGLIDEAGDLRREVEKCLRKLWGAKRISAHLWSRGFGADAMSELPEVLEEIDFASNCAALIRKHYGDIPSDQGEQRKMFASLTRYGYSLGEIKTALSLIANNAVL